MTSCESTLLSKLFLSDFILGKGFNNFFLLLVDKGRGFLKGDKRCCWGGRGRRGWIKILNANINNLRKGDKPGGGGVEQRGIYF